MVLPRYTFLLILTLISSNIFSTEAQQQLINIEEIAGIEYYAQQWVNHHISHLSPADMQVTANMLYLLYAGAVIDYTVRSAVPAMMSYTWTIRNKIKDYQECTSELTTLKKLINNMQEWDHARIFIHKTLNSCDTYMDEHCSKEVKEACSFIQQHGQQLLARYAEKHEQVINHAMQLVQQKNYVAGQFLLTAGNTLAGLCSGFPVDHDPQYKKIKRIEAASNIADKSAECATSVIETSNTVSDVLIELIQLGKIMYALYYKSIYTFMKEQLEPDYITVFFAPEGIIPESLRTEPLPDPEKVTANLIQYSYNKGYSCLYTFENM